MATNEEVCKEIHIQKHSGHEPWRFLWWGNSVCCAFPPILLFSNCVQMQNCISQPAHINITGVSHSSFKAFSFQQQQKIKRKKLPTKTEKCEGEQMDPEEPTATISPVTHPKTALKLHQWRTTHSHIHPLAPDSFIPKKPLHKYYTWVYPTPPSLNPPVYTTLIKSKILGEISCFPQQLEEECQAAATHGCLCSPKTELVIRLSSICQTFTSKPRPMQKPDPGRQDESMKPHCVRQHGLKLVTGFDTTDLSWERPQSCPP